MCDKFEVWVAEKGFSLKPKASPVEGTDVTVEFIKALWSSQLAEEPSEPSGPVHSEPSSAGHAKEEEAPAGAEAEKVPGNDAAQRESFCAAQPTGHEVMDKVGEAKSEEDHVSNGNADVTADATMTHVPEPGPPTKIEQTQCDDAAMTLNDVPEPGPPTKIEQTQCDDDTDLQNSIEEARLDTHFPDYIDYMVQVKGKQATWIFGDNGDEDLQSFQEFLARLPKPDTSAASNPMSFDFSNMTDEMIEQFDEDTFVAAVEAAKSHPLLARYVATVLEEVGEEDYPGFADFENGDPLADLQDFARFVVKHGLEEALSFAEAQVIADIEVSTCKRFRDESIFVHLQTFEQDFSESDSDAVGVPDMKSKTHQRRRRQYEKSRRHKQDNLAFKKHPFSWRPRRMGQQPNLPSPVNLLEPSGFAQESTREPAGQVATGQVATTTPTPTPPTPTAAKSVPKKKIKIPVKQEPKELNIRIPVSGGCNLAIGH